MNDAGPVSVPARLSEHMRDRWKVALRRFSLPAQELKEVGLNRRQANRFPARFDATQILQMAYQAGITPQAAAAYPARFRSDELIALATGKWLFPAPKLAPVPPERATAFNERFDGYQLIPLAATGIAPERAAAYPARLTGYAVAVLIGAGVEPEQAALFDVRFSAQCIAAMVRAGVAPETTATFPVRFDGVGIAALVAAAVSPTQAIEYDERFSGEGVACLAQAGIGPDAAAQYPPRFDGWYVTRLRDAGLSAVHAHTRPQDFTAGWPCLAGTVPVHTAALETVDRMYRATSVGTDPYERTFYRERCTSCDQQYLCAEYVINEDNSDFDNHITIGEYTWVTFESEDDLWWLVAVIAGPITWQPPALRTRKFTSTVRKVRGRGTGPEETSDGASALSGNAGKGPWSPD